MHQVLSYETAVHANSSRDPREYMTKRTCLMLVITVAFCTMVSGFLLGKFLADHQHNKRHPIDTNVANVNIAGRSENSLELSSADYRILKQMRNYQHSKELLLSAARQLGKRLQQNNNSNNNNNNNNHNSYLPSSLNTEIFNKYISCTQDIPPNTNIDSSKFIEELINNTAARQRDCLRIIQMIIDNNLVNS